MWLTTCHKRDKADRDCEAKRKLDAQEVGMTMHDKADKDCEAKRRLDGQEAGMRPRGQGTYLPLSSRLVPPREGIWVCECQTA